MRGYRIKRLKKNNEVYSLRKLADHGKKIDSLYRSTKRIIILLERGYSAGRK